MKRIATSFMGIALAMSLAACGGGNNNGKDGGSTDMAGNGGNDMAGGGGNDMALAGLPTGAPCMADKDCAPGLGPNQTKTFCVKSTGMGAVTWPGGYCVTQCRPMKTDPSTGINSDCPGGAGTCAAVSSTMGECRAVCPTSMGSADCRMGYACFVVNNYALGCEPKSLSQCDPSKKGSCANFQDMGAMQACINVGDGTVGICERGCDPFNLTYPNPTCDPNSMSTACHASDVTGEGFCDSVQPDAMGNLPKQGSTCDNFFEACPTGMGCNSKKVCQPYCDTSGKHNCGMFNNVQLTCTDFPGGQMKIAMGGLGVCQ